VRKITSVAKEQSVGTARRRAHVGVAVDYRKAVAVLKGPARACGGADAGDIEGGLHNLFGRCPDLIAAK